MPRKLYVGNLPFSVTDQELRALFTPIAPVTRLVVKTDQETGRSKGYGFVDVATDADGQALITNFDGVLLHGRALTVQEAREKAHDGHQPRAQRHRGRDRRDGARDHRDRRAAGRW